MASFTDIIPKFNPYIQQLPVEAMTQVGMAKQQAYEQNVTKIQTQVDAIGGLDVSRDVDRKYLQSKINELGSKLNRLASADFSNFQLVNAVGGMTNQVVKDGVVQTAVNSTAWARKQREKIEKGKADGTWAIENEDLYNEQYKKWYNGTQAGESFSSEYVPYRDVYKKLREIAKDVGVEESLVQNLFNADGTVNKVMVETYSKGKNPNKIYDAFINGIDESDYRQLSITGRYKYKGYDAEGLSNVIKQSNEEWAATASSRKLDLEGDLKKISDARLKAKTAEEKKTLDESEARVKSAISKLDADILKSNQDFQDVRTKLLSGDEAYANAVRSKIHTNKFLTSLSKDFADKTSYVKYAENPLWKAIMEENKFAFDQWKTKQQLALDAQRNQIAAQANELKKKEIEQNAIISGMVAAPVPGDKADMTGRVVKDQSQLVEGRNQLLNQFALDAFNGDGNQLKTWVDAQSKIRPGVSRDELISEIGAKRYEALNKMSDKEKKNLNPNVLKAYSMFGEVDKTVRTYGLLMKTAQNNAWASLGDQGEAYNKALSNLKPKTFTYADAGKSVTLNLNAQDQTDIITFLQKGMFPSKEMTRVGDEALGRLQKKYGNTATNALVSSGSLENDAVNSSWWVKATLGRKPGELLGNDFSQVLKIANQDVMSKYGTALETEYQNAFAGYHPMNYSFTLKDTNRAYLTGKVAGAFTGRPDSDEIQSIMANSNSQIVLTPKPSLTGIGPTEYTFNVSGGTGDNFKSKSGIPISEETFLYLSDLPQAPRINTQQVLGRAITNLSPDGSSNMGGLNSPSTSWFKSGDFPYVKNYKISGGDFLGTEDGSFYPVIHIETDRTGTKPLYIQRSMDINGALNFNTSITDAMITNILNDRN